MLTRGQINKILRAPLRRFYVGKPEAVAADRFAKMNGLGARSVSRESSSKGDYETAFKQFATKSFIYLCNAGT